MIAEQCHVEDFQALPDVHQLFMKRYAKKLSHKTDARTSLEDGEIEESEHLLISG